MNDYSYAVQATVWLVVPWAITYAGVYLVRRRTRDRQRTRR